MERGGKTQKKRKSMFESNTKKGCNLNNSNDLLRTNDVDTQHNLNFGHHIISKPLKYRLIKLSGEISPL
jgi:hypothetical protein